MDMIIAIFVGAILIGVIAGIVKSVNNKKHKDESKIAFDNLKDFKADNHYLSASSGISIGFDNQRKKICFLDKLHKPTIFEYNKILQCEVIEDGETILKSSTSGTIGRTLLGGILGGGVGAIIGGTTGSKTQKENISSIDLKIVLNDTTNPIYKINFLNIKTKKGSFIYKPAYAAAEHWHGIISGLIRQGNDEDKNTPIPNTSPNASVADELKKLKELVDSGVITEDDFAKQKAKLIG